MSELPPIAFVMYTYDRMECAEPTLRAVLDMALYPEPVQVHIADDGTPASYTEQLKAVAGGYNRVRTTTVSNAERGGYGTSYNLACQATHSWNFAVLALEDDWLLQRELHLLPLVRTLAEVPEVRCIRLGFLSFTQELRGRLIDTPAGKMLLLDPESPEPHVFAGHARLETVAFQQDVGPWPERQRAGDTEFEVAHRPASRVGVAWPMDVVMPLGDLFTHVGSRSQNQVLV